MHIYYKREVFVKMHINNLESTKLPWHNSYNFRKFKNYQKNIYCLQDSNV